MNAEVFDRLLIVLGVIAVLYLLMAAVLIGLAWWATRSGLNATAPHPKARR